MMFGDIIRELLGERDISQKRLAADLNLAVSTVGNYIRNIREPDYETLKLFAKYFQVSTDFLLDFHSNAAKDHCEEQLLQIYRSLTPAQQELYIEQGKLFIKQNNKQKLTSSTSPNRADTRIS